ncbi:MAG TPA: DEAD/DEAH box helicase, partial [Rhizobiales bacterium]|nr:DEAD/DEAH box helicase [Hyphomicrobiales bacterium]
MRPQKLNPFFTGVTRLKGIGAKVEKTLAKLVRPGTDDTSLIVRYIDILLHLPTGLIDRRKRPTINNLPMEGIVTVEVTIGAHKIPPRHNKRVPYRVECFDDTGTLSLVFFHVHGDYLQRQLPVGEKRFISGAIEWYSGMPQMVHPDHMLTAAAFEKMPLLEPVYPLTAGLSGKVLSRAITQALDEIPDLEEWQETAWINKQKWPAFNAALRAVHIPADDEALDLQSPVRQRLAYDELLANQLALGLVRRHMKASNGRAIKGNGDLRQQVINTLPFSLTVSQKQSLEEILHDMASNDRMLRLLQGDVGSGKTIVAVIALLACVESNAQGALMVPTEILSRQHYKSLTELCEPAGVSVELLTGRDKGKKRQEKLDRLINGDIDILIGTHALFQSDVIFKDLALVIIDEQHRFGVHQRLALQSKATLAPDVLVMTATPIPRTLTLTMYGDMDVSRLTDKP